MAASSGEIDTAVLHQLLVASGPVTVEAIGRATGLPPVAAARAIDRLREAGCSFDAHPQHGVRLERSGLGCWADYIEARHAGRLGRRLSVYRQTSSTQERARQMVARQGADHDGTVVVADHQTAGRGRLGRRWLAPPEQALLMTAIIRHRQASLDRLMLGSCCGIAAAVEQLTDVSVQIRWPNDLLIGDAKLAGILVETVGPVALIGIGMNVAGQPAELPADADSPTRLVTSLAAHGAAIDRLRVLDVVLTQLDRALRDASDGQLLARWKQRASLLQRRVTVASEGRRVVGRVIDLDPADGLLIQTDGGAVVTLPAATTSLIAAS